jgi:hypothetical protein
MNIRKLDQWLISVRGKIVINKLGFRLKALYILPGLAWQLLKNLRTVATQNQALHDTQNCQGEIHIATRLGGHPLRTKAYITLRKFQ